MNAKHPVYVEVPPSPYTISRVGSFSTTLKENEPWRISHSTMEESAAASSLKRKLSYTEAPIQFPVAVMKKPKLVSDPVIPTGSGVPASGYIYCHQCGKKRDKEGSLVLRAFLSFFLMNSLDSVRCSFIEVYSVGKDRPAKTRRCHNKYCKSCLKNRYNEDINTIKANNATNPVQNGLIDETYDYKCVATGDCRQGIYDE
jgi:hypothetical protein